MANTLSRKSRSCSRSIKQSPKDVSAFIQSAMQGLTEAQTHISGAQEAMNARELRVASQKSVGVLLANLFAMLFSRHRCDKPRAVREEYSSVPYSTDRAEDGLAEAVRVLRAVHNDLSRTRAATDGFSTQAQRRDNAIRLIGSIMSAQAECAPEVDAAFGEFERLLSDYREEARYDNFPAEADAYSDLLLVKSRLSRIRLAPRLSRKNIVAVAGGFSSGKSSFINSLIGVEPDVLPTNITPTTSIPTFVFHNPDAALEICVFNENGGRQLIDAKALESLTHDFERDYGIPLRKIVNRLVVSAPDTGRLTRVAFVDTPGYSNPRGESGRGSDEQVALKEILSAEFLVWIIDCERGALSRHDLDYITRFTNARGSGVARSSPIYVVLNKADKKPSGQLETILDEVASTANKHQIYYAGIGLYSAHKKLWYGYRGKSFQAYLDEVNRIEPKLAISRDVGTVLDGYINFHRTEADRLIRHVGFLKRLTLLVDERQQLQRLMDKEMENACRVVEKEANRHERHFETYRLLRQQFTECMDRFTDALDAVGGV